VRTIVSVAESVGCISSAAKPYIAELPGRPGQQFFVLSHEVLKSVVDTSGLARWCLPEGFDNSVFLGKLMTEWAGRTGFNGNVTERMGIGLHTDAVAYASTMRAGNTKGILVGSMSVVSGRSVAEQNARQPLFAIREDSMCSCGCQGYCTIQGVMEILAWSFTILASGAQPTRRHDGSAWSSHDLRFRSQGPFPSAALGQVRGDWKGLVETFRFRSYKSDSLCFLCDAMQYTMGEMHFSDFRSNASHRNCLISHDEHMSEFAMTGDEPSHIFRVPGFILDFVAIDSMHSADLGCFQDSLGGLLWLEATSRVYHRSRKEGMKWLNAELKAFYAANPGLSSVVPLQYTQLFPARYGYPYLKCKAAETRHLADFGLLLARRHAAGDGTRAPFRFPPRHRMSGKEAQQSAMMIAMMEGMVDYHAACRDPEFSAAATRAAMYKYLDALGGLHRLWRDGCPADQLAGLPFVLRPKSHLMQHLVEDKVPLWGSPANFWTYRDESYIGAVKKIALKTRHPATMEQRMLEMLCILTKLQSDV
jgi:hypothetical protein